MGKVRVVLSCISPIYVSTNGETLGLLSHGFNHGKAWEAQFLDYVDRVRARHERAEPVRLLQALRTDVEDVLRKGIDLRSRQMVEARGNDV